MHRSRVGSLVAVCAVVAVVGVAAAPLHPARADGGLRLSILNPRDRSMVATAEGRVFVAGRAFGFEATAEQFDLVVLVDTSRSTALPAGGDIDGDGFVGASRGGRWIDGTSDDWGDTVLAAQVFATRTLLTQLDPETTRIGVVTFAGNGDPDRPDALRLVPLTHDFTLVHKALDYLLTQTPKGQTNIGEAIDTAVDELLGRGRSRVRSDVTRVVLLMTDGQPNLPFAKDPKRSAAYAVSAALRAASEGIRVDTFPIGESATRDITVTAEIASRTGGRFTPVPDPTALVARFENLHLTTLESLAIENATTGAAAEYLLLEEDGRFSAIVPLADGLNQLEIRARGSDGGRAVRRVSVELAPDGRAPPLSPRLARAQTRALQNRLLDLYREHILLHHQAEPADRSRAVDVRVESEATGSNGDLVPEGEPGPEAGP